MFKIAVCDDEPIWIEIIIGKIKQYLTNSVYKLYSYESSTELLKDVHNGNHFDLFIIDIEMPELNGMQLTKKIREIQKDVIIIFLTSHLNYAVDGYEYNIFRYIPKKDINLKLIKSLEDAFKLISITNRTLYHVQFGSQIQSIKYDDIIYLKKDGKNAVIYTSDNKELYVRKSLSTIYEELNSNDFLFIERGYIINMININKMINNSLEMKNRDILPVSRRNLKYVKELLNNYWSERI